MSFNKKLFEQKYVSPGQSAKVDTLFLIGNGFDIWQDLDTGYASFERFYRSHIHEILARLGIPARQLLDRDGKPVLDDRRNPVTYCDVELFYGDPNDPKLLPHEFWNDFETSLDKIDDQEVNRFFGKDPEGLRAIRRCANNAQRILREAFCDWIASIGLTGAPPTHLFGPNCLFVNFNYTDTLLKRFGVDPANEFHIHGEAADRGSIIFGHATHPELPYPKLLMGPDHPRFQGLYYVEEFLYNADKHVEDNYMALRIFLGLHAVPIRDIKHIYVLGLGFGDSDLGYIRHLIDETQGRDEDPEADVSDDEWDYLEEMDYWAAMNLNIHYAISHRERAMKRPPIPYPEYDALDELILPYLEDPYHHLPREDQMRLEAFAVRRRFWEEQEARDKKMTREYLRFLRKKTGHSYISPADAFLELEGDLPEDGLPGPQWHISYFSQKDREKIDAVMSGYGCRRYTLYPSIDECIREFQVP